jgi:hypothetical protein
MSGAKCELCGREGTRHFLTVPLNGREQVRCRSWVACARRIDLASRGNTG